eukprot:m.62033 g.62033  ORF g.62033 m.62033 type:complete len:89 (-) comp17641_c0_seq2:436-702(-)
MESAPAAAAEANSSGSTTEKREAKLLILSELQQLADTTSALTAELDTLIKTTTPGGDLYESQQNALASMSMWKDVVTTVPHTADAAGL